MQSKFCGIALLLALPLLAQQDNLVVSAPALVRPGQVLDITVKRTSTPLPAVSAATQVSLTFSGVVTSITVDTAPAGKQVSCGPQIGGTVICMATGFNTAVFTDGVVMVVHAVLGPVQNPNFTITNTNPISSLPSGDNVTVSVNPLVSVSAQSRCDINGDGQITGADVAIAIAQANGTTSGTTADMNGDGKVDVRDVQWISAALNGGVCR